MGEAHLNTRVFNYCCDLITLTAQSSSRLARDALAYAMGPFDPEA